MITSLKEAFRIKFHKKHSPSVYNISDYVFQNKFVHFGKRIYWADRNKDYYQIGFHSVFTNKWMELEFKINFRNGYRPFIKNMTVLTTFSILPMLLLSVGKFLLGGIYAILILIALIPYFIGIILQSPLLLMVYGFKNGLKEISNKIALK